MSQIFEAALEEGTKLANDSADPSLEAIAHTMPDGCPEGVLLGEVRAFV